MECAALCVVFPACRGGYEYDTFLSECILYSDAIYVNESVATRSVMVLPDRRGDMPA